jgi:hypothetical protein
MAFDGIPCISASISALHSALDKPVWAELFLTIDSETANIFGEVVWVSAAWTGGVMCNRTILVEFSDAKGVARDGVSRCIGCRHEQHKKSHKGAFQI